MLRQLVSPTQAGAAVRAVQSITTRRGFSGSFCALQTPPQDPLPSTPEMKAESWASSNSDDFNITQKVVGITKKLQRQGKPPIDVDKAFQKTFGAGKIYDPFDFSMTRVDMERKWARDSKDAYRNYRNGKDDVFEAAGIDPLDLYTMPEILSRFLSSTGQILPREVTGCNGKNQKKLGIAIKRAISAGLLSGTNRHARYMPKRLL